MSPLRALSASFVLPLLPGLAYVGWLGLRLGAGRRLAILHVAIVMGLVTVVLLALAALTRLPILRRRRSGRWLIAAVLTGTGSVLLAIYLGNVVSHLFWHDTLSFGLFRYFVLELHIVRDALPVPAVWVYVTLGAVLLLAAIPSILLSGSLLAAFDQLCCKKAVYGLVTGWILFLVASIVATVAWRPHFSLSSDSFESTQARYQARQLMRREPIVGLFFSDTGFYTFRDYWISVQSAREAEAIRASYPKDREFDHRNVVLIISDALRPDHMQVYGYERPTTPFLDGLYSSGELSRFELALASCPSSPCGISSILASRTLASILPEHFALHELLFDQGYQVHFLLAGDHDFIGLLQFYGDSVTRLIHGTDSRSFAATDDRVVLEALERTPDYAGVPGFFYFHLMAPHVLAPRLPENEAFLPAASELWLTKTKREDPSAREAALNFYDNGVRQADSTIRQIFESLAAKGYLDGALVVITSDHGEALGEKRPHAYRPQDIDTERQYGHSTQLYQELMSIPLLFWEQGGTPFPSREFARQIDLAPTIADRLGLPAPGSWRGTSLLRPPPPTEALLAAYASEPAYALAEVGETTIYKYIRYSTARWKPREELYELRSDPGEQRNLIRETDPQLVGRLRERLEAALRGEDY